MNSATLIGDLLHHKGTLIDMRQLGDGSWIESVLTFGGYAQLLAAWPASGIGVTENANGTITLTSTDPSAVKHDIWPVTTNLIGWSGADLKDGVTLYNRIPAQGGDGVSPVFQTTAEYSRDNITSFGTVDAFALVDEGNFESEAVALSQRVMQYHDDYGNGAPMQIHRRTVAEVLTLDAFGTPSIPGQNTSVAEFTNRALVLTPWGLALKCTLELLPNYPLLTAGESVRPHPTLGDWFTLNPLHQAARPVGISGGKVIYQFCFFFTGYGWASEVNPQFLSPRKRRILSETDIFDNAWDAHPNIGDQPTGVDGKDYSIKDFSEAQVEEDKTEIAMLTPLAGEGSLQGTPLDFPMHETPDALGDFLDNRETYTTSRDNLLAGVKSQHQFVRVNLLREHFNCIANRCNQLKKASPYRFDQHNFIGYGRILSNSVGPFGDPLNPLNPLVTVRPRDHYATVSSDPNSSYYPLHEWAEANGVPIKTADDLPEDFLDLRRTVRDQRRIARSIHARSVVSAIEDLGGGLYNLTLTETYTVGSFTDTIIDQSGHVSDDFEADYLFNPDYKWITVQDVQQAAVELGFHFWIERVVVPLTVKTFTLGPATELQKSGNAVTYVTEAVGPYYAVGTVLLDETRTANTDYISNVARAIDATTDDEAKWVFDGEGWPTWYLVDHHAGDVKTILQNHLTGSNLAPATGDLGLIYKLAADRRYLRDITELSMWKPFKQRDDHPNIGIGTASVLVQSFHSALLAPQSSIVLINSDAYEHDGEEFSARNYESAIARQIAGNRVIPVKTVQATPGCEIITCDQDETFIAARPNKVQKVMYLQDWPMSLE